MKFKIAILAALLASGFAHAHKGECLNQAGNLLADSMDKQTESIIRENSIKNQALIDNWYHSNNNLRTNPPRWLDEWYERGMALHTPGAVWQDKALHDVTVDYFAKQAEGKDAHTVATAYAVAEAAHLMARCGFNDAK